jgi:putative membrane protein
MTLAEVLPSVNAALNATSAGLLFVGWRAIRTKRTLVHRFCMQGAFATSCIFLVSYLTRVALTGTHRYPGSGWMKSLYIGILASHTLLAVVTVPLVLRALFLARRSRFVPHRRIARFAFPVWMYVSVTGVVVYVMLYHLA